MAYKLTNLTLPAFTFLDSAFNSDLDGRNCILHVRSMSVVEVLDLENAILNDDVITYHFSYGFEQFVAALHFSATLTEKEDIIQLVMKPLAEWYCHYCEWEDNNIANEDFTANN